MAEVEVFAQAGPVVELISEGGLKLEVLTTPPAQVEVFTEGTQGARGLQGEPGAAGAPGSGGAGTDPGDLILYFQNGLT